MEILNLTGSDLTIAQVAEVAINRQPVVIAEEAKERIRQGRQLVFDLVDSDVPIYGFNVGVGWNKDVKVLKEFFQQYNNNLIRSHCISIPPHASEDEVRAVMLARLNTLLVGCTGLSPEIPQMYAEMLNREIHPLLPERGSVGEGDIGCLSHIGLAMIGEGQVNYKGQVINAAQALEAEGLSPLVLGPKDGLAIVSSNALSAGQGSLLIHQLKELMVIADLIYAMSLSGLNGNTSPLHPSTHKVRPFKGQSNSAQRISRLLEGSFLYDPDPDKPVQDPLCFRDAAHVHGAVWDAIEYTESLMQIQLNSSDDNPCLSLEERTIMSCANFEPLTWVLGFEMLGIALSHLSKMACLRTIKLVNPEFTNLNRFLACEKGVICYGTIQKTFALLDTEIRLLTTPSSADGFPLAGEIEDHQTNAPLVVQKTRKIVDNIRYILAIELIHAAQALDYRKERTWGKSVKNAYEKVRETISFYDRDRNLSNDIQAAYNIIKSGELLDIVELKNKSTESVVV